MQGASLLSSSPPAIPPTSLRLPTPFPTPTTSMLLASSPPRLCSSRFLNHRFALPPLNTTATQEHESQFVEVGYIANVHGLQGEARVKPTTDFPELRFAKPGRRWLRQQVLGREIIKEVELEEGRGHPGQKSWILKFNGIDTVDQAKQLIGSTILVSEEERPDLEEGEFYTRDLVGMRVFLKETGDLVGTVVNIFDSGGSDLLQVMLDSSLDVIDETGKQKSAATKVSGHLVWVPFVEAIVPIVDMKKREMQIIPPKGLLQLNLRHDERSKKERRLIEWKERKKSQKRLIAAKKKLCELEQKHVFDGLRFGEKEQRSFLAEQIVGVNSKLLQLALQNIDIPSKRWNIIELVSAMKTDLIRSKLSVSEDCLTSSATKDKLGGHFPLQEKGLQLISEGKVAVILLVNESDYQERAGDLDPEDSESTENSSSLLQTLVDDKRFVKIEDRASVPLILVSSSYEVQALTTLFSNNDHFSFDPEKVQFLAEEKLPVISNSSEKEKRHKILMGSPWEILQTPVGAGGVLSLLSSHDIVDNLSEKGVECIQVLNTNQRYTGLNSLLLGFAESCKADIGIQIPKDTKDLEESCNMVFSMKFIKKLTKQMDKLQFHAIPKQNLHVELINKEWVDVVPSIPNSYELCCSIYSSLNACSFDQVCVMEITE
ncbi:hypothetical protein UlMin_018827 [Ulmus minor]